MADAADSLLVPRRSRRLEVMPGRDGRADVLLSRTRRLSLAPDALWLLERIDGVSDVGALAAQLSRRFGREVTPADALAVLRGTLVAHGLIELQPQGTVPAVSPPLRRGRGWTLMRADDVRRWARATSLLASPRVAAAALLASAAAIGWALRPARLASAESWSEPGAWAFAVSVALVSLFAHEIGHAAALARAGGVPGEMTAWWSGNRARLAIELAGLASLPARSRLGVDVAGVAAQLIVAGAGAAAARGLGLPAAPVAALTLLAALGNLVPMPGTDGRWLLDDLAMRDPSDDIRRRVGPGRWLSRARARLLTRLALASGRGPFADQRHLLPVLVSASFPDWSPQRLRRHTADFFSMQAVSTLDQLDLPRGASADDVRHVRGIRELLGRGQGAIVCGMHVGPYAFVPEALTGLGARVLAYVAPNQMERWSATWQESARRRGRALELLSPLSARDTVRAVRAVREGALLFVLMDGQIAMARDQHRADFRFLGNELFMRTGPALLSRRTGAPIVLAFTRYAGVARRVVEFSGPFPLPDTDAEEALVARTAELYAWFEPRVARVAPQWDGWAWPVAHWRASGRAPTATQGELHEALRRARQALDGAPANARVRAEPAHVHWMRTGDEHLLVHGPPRRVLVASELACRVVAAAHRGARARDLPRRTGAAADALAPELARLVLAGLVTLEA